MFWIGLVLFVVVGGELGAVVSGATRLGDGGVGRFVIGVNLVPWTGLVAGAMVFAGRRSRAGLQVVQGPMSPALARVEAARATGDGPEHLVHLDLTVAPKGRGAYRVNAVARVNVMDLSEYRAGRTLDVSHDPERPWRVTVPGRQTGAVQVPLDTAPESTRETAPKPVPASARGPLLGCLLAVLAGTAGYLLIWGL
ncbi:hypothetical protein [Streptomyces sp. TLI_171]|uniref:hypothetical protein n=1 Tax=Streptomyces sp. TLI_171 TaxID=1938859 RepID=UPI000C17E0B8|nr:hypothetical protein [Streptomyces sp. TLI_171]RKE21771.1 hypothetical protein BX266_5171 [Streptomyces sp. TLI_171]